MNTSVEIMINTSQDEKALFGYASSAQARIVALGVFLGLFIDMIMTWFMNLIGVGKITIFIVMIIFLVASIAPFAYNAFMPVRGGNGIFLYYKSYQRGIEKRYLEFEVGTYVNIHERPTRITGISNNTIQINEI